MRTAKTIKFAGTYACFKRTCMSSFTSSWSSIWHMNTRRRQSGSVTFSSPAMTDIQNDLEKRLAERDAELLLLRKEFKQMKEQASKDPLTKLATRSAFFEALQSAIAVAQQDGKDLSLMMIDIDHFKGINDQHGHLMGDMALQSFGTLLLDCIDKNTVAARYGGEEFVVILPNTRLPEALKLANTLRRDLKNLKMVLKDGYAPDISVTVSIGIAQFQEYDSVRQLIDRADSELYAAKRDGRNRVRPSVIS